MPFQPGQSGNPSGRPKLEKTLIGETLRRAALAGADELRKGADAILLQASKGDLDAWTYLRDTLDGKPKQGVELSSDPDNPLVMQHVIARATLEGTIKGE